MKRLLLILATAMTTVVIAGDPVVFQLPSSPSVVAEDFLETRDIICKNSIGGATNLEYGITGIQGRNNLESIAVYARIVIPLDGPKERMNCNSLFELELRARALQIERLEAEIAGLKGLEFK